MRNYNSILSFLSELVVAETSSGAFLFRPGWLASSSSWISLERKNQKYEFKPKIKDPGGEKANSFPPSSIIFNKPHHHNTFT